MILRACFTISVILYTFVAQKLALYKPAILTRASGCLTACTTLDGRYGSAKGSHADCVSFYPHHTQSPYRLHRALYKWYNIIVTIIIIIIIKNSATMQLSYCIIFEK